MEFKILVVDDDPEAADLLAGVLSSRGHKVSVALSGAKAVEMVGRERFHLVLCDVVMPGMGGLEVLEAVKALDPAVEVILATSEGLDLAAQAARAGAFDLVEKPWRVEEISKLAERVLDRTGLRTILGVYEASRAVFSCLRAEELLPRIVHLAMETLRADDASLMLLDREGRLEVAAVSAAPGDPRRQARLKVGERVAGRVAQWKEPVIIRGPLGEDPRFAGLIPYREIASSIVYPLIIQGEVLGVLNVNRTLTAAPFTAADLRQSSVFASQIAQAVRNSHVVEDLQAKIRQLEHTELKLAEARQMAAEARGALAQLVAASKAALAPGGRKGADLRELEAALKEAERAAALLGDLAGARPRASGPGAPSS